MNSHLESWRVEFVGLREEIGRVVNGSEERKDLPTFRDEIALKLHVLYSFSEREW